jgi:hypothetical protein
MQASRGTDDVLRCNEFDRHTEFELFICERLLQVMRPSHVAPNPLTVTPLLRLKSIDWLTC